ncbi:hypothetical protein N0V90_000621 [Kalmusia sp. IMI 367209]|nr:hypothetical protein N0V90_000621 [Kalmusia sp. IMI 367209]
MAGAKLAPPDNETSVFPNMLQGLAVRVIVGTKTSTFEPLSYILPQRLLSIHSLYFKAEIVKLNVHHATSRLSSPSTDNAPPEKLAESLGRDTAPTPSPNPGVPAEVSSIPTIHLPDIDPDTFGLFITFIYQGYYKPRFNANIFTITPQNAFFHVSIESAKALFQKLHATDTYAAKNLPIPSPLLAHALGTFLAAPAFTNYSMTQIYNHLGAHFSLTPVLVSWVLTCTPPAGVLRRFILDVLSQYWSVATLHVAKPEGPLKEGWEKLFESETQFRREFIFGMGVGGRRVGGLRAYYVPPPMSAPAAALPSKETQIKEEGDADVQEVPKPALVLPSTPASARAPTTLASMPYGPGAVKSDEGPPAKRQKVYASEYKSKAGIDGKSKTGGKEAIKTGGEEKSEACAEDKNIVGADEESKIGGEKQIKMET